MTPAEPPRRADRCYHEECRTQDPHYHGFACTLGCPTCGLQQPIQARVTIVGPNGYPLGSLLVRQRDTRIEWHDSESATIGDFLVKNKIINLKMIGLEDGS